MGCWVAERPGTVSDGSEPTDPQLLRYLTTSLNTTEKSFIAAIPKWLFRFDLSSFDCLPSLTFPDSRIRKPSKVNLCRRFFSKATVRQGKSLALKFWREHHRDRHLQELHLYDLLFYRNSKVCPDVGTKSSPIYSNSCPKNSKQLFYLNFSK